MYAQGLLYFFITSAFGGARKLAAVDLPAPARPQIPIKLILFLFFLLYFFLFIFYFFLFLFLFWEVGNDSNSGINFCFNCNLEKLNEWLWSLLAQEKRERVREKHRKKESVWEVEEEKSEREEWDG